MGCIMQRYFVKPEDGKFNLSEKRIILTSNIIHHIKNVLKMAKGEKVIIVFQEQVFLCEITALLNQEVHLKIIEELFEENELYSSVTIAQGIVRREKMETTIENISQLGASFYQPVILKRCNVKIKDDFNKKLSRLDAIAKEACELAHRKRVLRVNEILSFQKFLDFSKSFDLCLVAHVDHQNEVLISDVYKKQKNILVLVGPEGGFDDSEIESLKKHHFVFISLGKRVLRTELAPSYILSVIDFLEENNEF